MSSFIATGHRPLVGLSEAARRTARGAGFVALTGAMLPTFALRDRLASHGARDAVRDRWVKRWCDLLLSLFAVEAIVEPLPAKTPTRGRLIVANHRSMIDVGLMLSRFGGRMVSRGDLSRWPLLGAAARVVGTVFVDRERAESGASAIRAMRQLLLDGQTVCLFPEGTTFDGDELRPFHGGAFIAATRTGAEIVPVGVAYAHGSAAAFGNETFLQHLGRLAGARRTRVAVCVGQPTLAGDGIEAGELRAATHRAMQALVHRARARVDPAGATPAASPATPPCCSGTTRGRGE